MKNSPFKSSLDTIVRTELPTSPVPYTPSTTVPDDQIASVLNSTTPTLLIPTETPSLHPSLRPSLHPSLHPSPTNTFSHGSIGPIDPDQQARLDKYLALMLAKQEQLTIKKPAIVYEVHPESGIGNMIRGYITGLVIASVSNRGLMSTFLSLSFTSSQLTQALRTRVFHPSVPKHAL